MTLPDERFRSIRHAREFLRNLLDPTKTPRVPKAVRKEAYWVLRHFPGECDMAFTCGKAAKVWGAYRRPEEKK
jgi:hypothetical protein